MGAAHLQKDATGFAVCNWIVGVSVVLVVIAETPAAVSTRCGTCAGEAFSMITGSVFLGTCLTLWLTIVAYARQLPHLISIRLPFLIVVSTWGYFCYLTGMTPWRLFW